MKFKKLLILPLFALLATGCEFINFYTPQNNNNENINNGLTNNNPNSTNTSYTTEWNYNGTINYANNTQTKLSPEEIYQNGVTSTVYIIASTLDATYLGSGVFFSEDSNEDGYAYLFTNAHVIEGTNNIEIIYSNFKRDTATVVGYHTLEDIAVLAVKKNDNYTIATLKNIEDLSPASPVLTIGTPISTDHSFSATSGILSKIDSPLTSTLNDNYSLLLLQIDATLNSGNSGGPLFDEYGNLIGLNTLKVLYDDNRNEVDDLNFAIPIDRAVFLANRFFNNKTYTRGLLGITITDIVDLSMANRESYNITRDYGLLVVEVSVDGASKDIIEKDDIITKINGIEFQNKYQFQKELFNNGVGDTISLTIYRNGSYSNVNVTLK